MLSDYYLSTFEGEKSSLFQSYIIVYKSNVVNLIETT